MRVCNIHGKSKEGAWGLNLLVEHWETGLLDFLHSQSNRTNWSKYISYFASSKTKFSEELSCLKIMWIIIVTYLRDKPHNIWCPKRWSNFCNKGDLSTAYLIAALFTRSVSVVLVVSRFSWRRNKMLWLVP